MYLKDSEPEIQKMPAYEHMLTNDGANQIPIAIIAESLQPHHERLRELIKMISIFVF